MFPQQLLSQESMLVCEYFSDGIQLNVAQALACLIQGYMYVMLGLYSIGADYFRCCASHTPQQMATDIIIVMRTAPATPIMIYCMSLSSSPVEQK